jgi:predicted N-acetyltransferase YhbS
MEIRLLRESDDRTQFKSGDANLDNFFSRYAWQNQFRHHIGTTYVAVDGNQILGYATVAAANLELEKLPAIMRRRLPSYPLPVLRLGRLAVEVTAQGRGVGSVLLRHVFDLAMQMSNMLGCVGVVVDAKHTAVEFYSRFGFFELQVEEGPIEARPVPTPMFIPLGLVRAAAEKR